MEQQVAEFENIIAAILSHDNDARRQAEQAYFQSQEDPNTFYFILTTILASSPNYPSRVFAAVLMRQQLLPTKKLFYSVSPEVCQRLKETCVHLFQNESDAYMRNKVIELMSVLAAFLFTQAERRGEIDITIDWPEVLPLTMHGCQPTSPPEVQEACFHMINKIAEFSVAAIIPISNDIVALLNQGMQSEHLNVAVTATNSALSVLASLELLASDDVTETTQRSITLAQQHKTVYYPAIPLACQVLARALTAYETIAVGEIIQSLDHIIRLAPDAFGSCVKDVIQFVDQLARHEELDPALRHSAITLLVSFGSTPNGRKLIRKEPSYQSTLLALCFDFIQRIDTSTHWAQHPLGQTEDEEEYPDHYMGIYIIENLPNAIGLKTFITPLIQEVLKRVQTNKWKVQLASLTILHTVAEAFLRAFPKPAINTIATMLIALINPKNNTHDRVKAALCRVIANMCEKLTQKNGLALLPHVITLLNPQHCPTVIYFGLFALSNLIGLLKENNLAKFVESILSTTIPLLSHASLPVKLLALTTLSSVALNQEQRFGPYCDQIITGLTQMIRATNEQISNDPSLDWETRSELRRMRSKGIETISFIASAVGVEVFTPYSQVCIALMVEAQQQELKAVNPEVDSILRSYEKLAEVLGSGFTPYAPLVLPGIFESAAAEDFVYRFDLDENNQLSITDQAKAEELTRERGFQSISVGFRGVGTQKMFLNVSVVQDKIQALELIGQFSLTMDDAFGPYIQQAANVLFPCCSSTANPRIRMSAVTSVPALLECVSKQSNATPQSVMDFFTQCLQAFDLETWVRRELPEGLSFLISAIVACLDTLPQPLPINQLEHISKSLLAALQLCKERRKSIEDEVDGTDEEQVEDKAEAMAHENSVLDSVVALNTALLKINPQEYMPFFDNVLAKEFQTMLHESSNGSDVYMGVCAFVAFADTIGTGKELAKKYISEFLPHFIQHAADAQNHELRRACAYGIAACHRSVSREEFAPFLNESVKVLTEALKIEEEDAELYEDCEYATDNVLVGLCDIITQFGFGDNAIPDFAASLIPQVIPKLGRFHDEEECISIHKNFAYWLVHATSIVFGPENAHLPYVITAIASILDYDQEYHIINDEDKETVMNTWRNIRSSFGPEVTQKLLQFVQPDVRSLLEFQ